MATQPFRNGGDFTGDVTFNDSIEFGHTVTFTPQAGYPATGYTNNYIKALPSGFAFGTVNGSTLKAFSFNASGTLPVDSTTTITINAGGTMVTSSNLAEQLKTLPGYNASVAQTLQHDASGNISWVSPAP